jgi:hypothetical protein
MPNDEATAARFLPTGVPAVGTFAERSPTTFLSSHVFTTAEDGSMKPLHEIAGKKKLPPPQKGKTLHLYSPEDIGLWTVRLKSWKSYRENRLDSSSNSSKSAFASLAGRKLWMIVHGV